MSYLTHRDDSTKAVKHRGRRCFLTSLQVLIIVGVIGFTTAALAQPKTTPVTLNNLLRALGPEKGIRRLTAKELVALLDKNGVDFQLTDEDERRIRASGTSYGPQRLDTIVAAVRRNFRPASSGSSPLQVRYHLVAGNSIDFFLRKDSRKDWQMLDIDGRVTIVPNNTYQTLAQLARNFSVPFEGDYFDSRNAERRRNETDPTDPWKKTELASSYEKQKREVFVGSGGWDDFPGNFTPIPDFIKSLENPAKPWRIYLIRKPADDFGSSLLRTRDIFQINQFCLLLTGTERDDQLVARITAHIRDQFSPSTRKLLQDCNALWWFHDNPEPGLRSLVEDLNKILRGPSLYHQEAFKEAKKLSPTPLPAQSPTGEELVRLNRKFLVRIYPKFVGKEDDSSPFVFLRQLEREDFSQLSVLGRFYAHITRNNLPSDFGYLYVKEETNGGCGDPPDEPETNARATVVAPYLALWIGVFENVTDKPIRVGNFALRENVSNRLRTREEDTQILNAQSVRQVPLYPVGTLRPNEKVIIPLELVLLFREDIKQIDPNKVGEDERELIITSTQLTKVDEARPFTKTPQISLPSGIISTATIMDILRKPTITFAPRQKYVYGPSTKIDNVEVNETRYQVRSFNPDRPLITSSGYFGGSCPFIYTYDVTKRSWINEGVIMAGFDSKTKESTDVKFLHRFNGRILLEEREAEDSFVDFLQVRVKTVDGTEILLQPKNKLLLAIDGNYVKLRQGERLVIDFDMPKGIQALEYRLEVSGYYVPYEHGQQKRAQ